MFEKDPIQSHGIAGFAQLVSQVFLTWLRATALMVAELRLKTKRSSYDFHICLWHGPDNSTG